MYYAVVFEAIPSGLLQLCVSDVDLNIKLDGVNILDIKCNNDFLRQICRPFRIPNQSPIRFVRFRLK